MHYILKNINTNGKIADIKIVIDEHGIMEIARKAIRNKSGRSKFGPIKAKFLHLSVPAVVKT